MHMSTPLSLSCADMHNYTYMCTSMYMCLYVFMYFYSYVYIYIYRCVFAYICTCVFIHIGLDFTPNFIPYIYIYIKDMVYNSIYQTNSGQLNDKMEKLQSDTFHFHVNGGSLRLLEIYNKEWLHYYIKKLKDIAMIHFKFKSFIFKVSRCLTC